jgi:hypothetical protein
LEPKAQNDYKGDQGEVKTKLRFNSDG